MFTWIMTALVALFVLFNALLGLRRGTFRALVRFCLLLLSIPLAIWLTKLLCGSLEKFVTPLLNDALAQAGTEMTDAMASVVHAVDALAAMLCAALSFSGVYLFVSVLTKLADKPLAALLEKRVHLKISSRLTGFLLGILSGILWTVAVFCPLNGLLPVANSALQLVNEEEEEIVFIQTELQQYTDSTVHNAISKLGGDAIFSAVTTVTYEEEKVNLVDEVGAITDLIQGIVLLSEDKASEWDEQHIQYLNDAADAFDASRITADVVASLLTDVGATWSQGEPYMGMQPPALGELLDPSVQTLLATFAHSTGDTVRQNVHTAANILGTMIEYDVFLTLEQSKSEDVALSEQNDFAVLTVFSDAEFTGRVVTALYEDRQLRVLIPEILNLGVRAVALSLGVPNSYADLYDDLLQDCCDAFNKTAGQPDVDRMVVMGDELYDALMNAGVSISPSAATAMAMGMVADLGSENPVTVEMMQAWFAGFAAAQADNAPDSIALMQSEPALIPLSMTETTPALIPLGSDTALFDGAASAAAYIAAMQSAPAPYQMLTIRQADSGKVYRIVSMSDGTMRAFDANGIQFSVDELNAGTLGVLHGGEFSAIRCENGFEVVDGPSRIDAQQLSELSAALLTNLSPLPEGYTPTKDSSGTPITSQRMQNAQNTPSEITDTASLLSALSIAANHELANGSYTTGSVNTMTSSETFVSTLPCLDTMLLSDVQGICDNMSVESALGVGATLSSLASYIGTATSDPEALIDNLFSTEGVTTISSLLDCMTDLSGDRTAAVNTLLAGLGSRGGDVSALRSLLENEEVSVSGVAGQILSTSGALTSLTTATTPDEQIEAIEAILSNLTEDGAMAIAAVATPSLLESIGLPRTLSESYASLIRSTFETLAQAKKNGMTDEQFRRESEAFTTLFTMSQNAHDQSGSDRIFGADGVLEQEASELLDTILSSNIISGALIDMVGGSKGAYFSIAHANPLGIPSLSDADVQSLRTAIEQAEKTLPQLPNSNGELWTPQNNQITRQDTARRITAFASLFGLDYICDYVNIDG